MFLTLLPFLSSGFVPTASMPGGLRQFAEYQPFTAVTQTVRGLLTDTAIGTHAIQALGWSVGIAAACYLWSVRLYERPEQPTQRERPQHRHTEGPRKMDRPVARRYRRMQLAVFSAVARSDGAGVVPTSAAAASTTGLVESLFDYARPAN